MTKVSRKLKRLRDLWGHLRPLSQVKAAVRIGVSRRSWIGWERGQRVPPRHIALLIDLLLEKEEKLSGHP